MVISSLYLSDDQCKYYLLHNKYLYIKYFYKYYFFSNYFQFTFFFSLLARINKKTGLLRITPVLHLTQMKLKKSTQGVE